MIARRGSTIVLGVNKTSRLGSYRSLRDGPCLPITQAFHAWLPSFGPSGTWESEKRDERPQALFLTAALKSLGSG